MTKAHKKKKKSGNAMSRVNINGAKQQYDGPLRIPRASLQEDTTVAELVYVGANTASSSTINSVWGLNPSVFNNYTNYTQSYDEFRCLAAEFFFIPNAEDAVQTASGSTLYAPFCVVLDRDSNGALSSYTSAFEFASCKVKAINKTLKCTFKMSGSEDAAFGGTPTVASAYFKTYATGLSASGTYGQVFVKAIFQFRGRF